MKRILLLSFALLAVYVAQAGNPYKYELRIGWGTYPEVDVANFMDRSYYYADTGFNGNYPSLDSMYGEAEGACYMTGPITGEFSMHVNRWFTFSAIVSFNGMWGSSYSQIDGSVTSVKRGVSCVFLPQAKFYWSNKKNVRWYSAVGIGLQAGGYDGTAVCVPAGQVTLVGVTFGRKIFGFAEYTLGTMCMGAHAGIGYRF